MNLLFLVICNVVLITCSFGIPRQRTQQTKAKHSRSDSSEYNAVKFQNVNQERIPLEVLESELLHSKNHYKRNPSNLLPKKTMKNLNDHSCRPAFARHPKTDKIPASVKDNCIYCKHSPSKHKYRNSKSKSRLKKSYKRSFEPENNLIESVTISSQVQSTFEDFFSLFEPDTPTTQEGFKYCKSSILPSTITSNEKEISPGVSDTVENEVSAEGQSKQSLKYPLDSNKGARSIALPGNVSKIESNSKWLFLDDLNSRYFKQEDEGGEAGINLPHTSEEAKTDNVFTLFSSLNENSVVSEIQLPDLKVTTETLTESQLTDLKPHSLENTAVTSSNHKENCQVQSKRKCICSFANLSLEIHSIFTKSNTPRNALDKFKEMHCSHYVPKCDMFEISSHSKPKELDKQKKSIAVNEEKGPKEIDLSSLNEFIAQSVVSEEDDLVNVFAGSDVKVPCFPTGGIHLLASDTDDVKYKWSHQHDKPISEGNIKENTDGEGTLSIEDINISDSDNYTCNVEYINPDSGHLKKETYTHSVSVVSLPILTVHVLVHYRAPQCGNSVTDIFRRYLPPMVEQAICDTGDDKHLCSVEIHNAVCVDSSSSTSEDDQPIERTERKAQSSQREGPYWLRKGKREVASKEISLNYEVCVHKRDERALTATNSSLCDANCHLVIGLKLLQLFRESMAEAVTTPVSLNMNNVSGTFHPVPSTVKIKYIFGCLGGDFYKGQGFCTACPRHTFSEQGAIVCTQCPPHTYQGGMGASKCIPCTMAWMPACNEYLEDTNKYIVGVVAVVVLIVLLSVIIWYFFGNRERREANVKKLVSSPIRKKNKLGPSRKAKFGKSQKSIRRKLPTKSESTELQPFLDSSTGGETSATEDNVGHQR